MVRPCISPAPNIYIYKGKIGEKIDENFWCKTECLKKSPMYIVNLKKKIMPGIEDLFGGINRLKSRLESWKIDELKLFILKHY